MSQTLCLLIDGLRDPGMLPRLSVSQWESVIRLARFANLLPRLAVTVADAGLLAEFPEVVIPHLRSAEVIARHQRQAIEWEVRHIRQAVDSLGLRIVLLKGAAYAIANLRAASGRLFGDVDILVPEQRLSEVEAALMLHGWSAGQINPYDDRYYRQWMHELPPMTHLKRGTVVDVHHNILPRTARDVPPISRMVAQAREIEGSGVAVLAPHDMVIHSAVHLFHEGELKNGFRDLFDLDDLMMEFSAQDEQFWRSLVDRARELHLEWPVRLAFRYLRYFLKTNIPESAQYALRQAPVHDRIRDTMYLRGFIPNHPLCADHRTGLARSLLYLRGHSLRMPAHLLATHLVRKAWMRMYTSSQSD